jgi:hypothetical protein
VRADSTDVSLHGTTGMLSAETNLGGITHSCLPKRESHCRSLRMCSVLEPGRTEWNGSISKAWNGSDPVFGLEKFEERNGSIPVFGFGMR